MSLSKTEKARQALQSRSTDLSARERQLLILCDGKRRTADLAALIGSEGHALIERLLRDGYLERLGTPARASTRAKAPVAAPAAAPESNAPKFAAKPAMRRSIAGTKMYMIDMLQLLRDMDASAIAVSIQGSADEAELVSFVLHGLQFIGRKSGASYAQRVAQRLAEVLPEAYLFELFAVVDQLSPVEAEAAA